MAFRPHHHGSRNDLSVTDLCGAQRRASGEMAAHPMHSSTGRGGGRAEVESFDRRRIEPWRRPYEELAEVLDAAVDIAAH